MNPLLAMSFLNPAFAWITLGLALIPLLIYILNRQRHRTVPWAAMRFLLAANRSSIRRTRLEHVLLLAVRTLMLVLLGLALARPMLQSKVAAQVQGERTHHIVVLDDSLSMSATCQPGSGDAVARTPFDVQLAEVRRLLDGIPTSDPLTLATMSHPAKLLNRQPTVDRTVAERLAAGVQPAQSHTDLAGVLQLFSALPRHEAASNQVVHLFSDFSAGFLGPMESAESAVLRSGVRQLAQRAKLALYDVCDDPIGNVAHVELRPMERLIGIGQDAGLVSTITNFSERRSDACRVVLSANGRPIREQSIEPMDAGASRTLTYSVEFDSPGLHRLEATLETKAGNALKADDTRRLVVDVREQVEVLIVEGQSGATRLQGEAGYLATALAPQVSDLPGALLKPVTIAESNISTQDPAKYALIILCNVRRLADETWKRLEGYVREGGGLLVYAGDLVDVEHYNQAGAAILPARLGEPAFVEPSSAEPVQYDPATLAETLAPDFRGRRKSGLFQAKVHQYLKMTPELGRSQTLLAYDNGDAAIVERHIGAGRCIMINTSANMAWNNLPARGDFITLVMNLIHRAAPDNARRRNLVVNEPYTEGLSAPGGSANDYRIRKPDGSEHDLIVEPVEDGLQLKFDALDEAGWYAVRSSAGETPVGVNVSSEESDLRAVEESQLRQLLGAELTYARASSAAPTLSRGEEAEASAVLAYSLLLLLLAETLLAMWFGQKRR